MKSQMIQIKLLKDWKSKRAGEIINISKKGAAQFISVGAAEYLDIPKENIKGIHKIIAKEHFNYAEYNEEDDIIEIGVNTIKQKYLNLIKDKKWNDASELLRDYILEKLRIYTIKDDQKVEMWVYKEGIYVPQGKSEIKEILRNLLGKWYSQWIFGKVIEKIEPDTYIEPENFFKINYKNEIPVLNGILNVETLELKPYNPNKIFFNKIPVTYDLSAQCPRIEEFLKGTLGNEEDIKVFYELAGFGLYKEYSIEKAFMLVGNGRNGKGKCIELLKKLVGADNCCSIPLVSLRCDGFSVSELFSKLFNLAGDIGNQDLKDTSMFKSLTGRDLVNGKRKFQKDIIFENYSKFVFACNELPMVYDLSKGFWDRWVLLEFPYTFVTQEEIDKAIDKTNLKLRNPNIIGEISTEEEMSGFLNQALIGLSRLKGIKNFSSTKGSEEIKSTWIKKSNSFIAFCYDNLEDDYDGKILKKELRKKYSSYCKGNKITPKSDFVMKRVLQDTFGVSEERFNVGIIWEWFWVGIKWKD